MSMRIAVVVLAYLCLIAGLFAGSRVAWGAPDSEEVLHVEAEGRANGAGEAAQAAAIAKAQEVAVCDAVAAWTGPYAERLCQAIAPEAEQYVSSYRLLERRVEYGETRVRIDAGLYYGPLREHAASLLLGLFREPPKVAVLFSEVGEEGEAPMRAGDLEAAVRKRLSDVRLATVSDAEIDGLIPGGQVARYAGGDDRAVGKLGRICLADVAVVGTLSVERDGDDKQGNVKPTRATLTLRAVRATDDRLLTAHSTSALVRTMDPGEGRKIVLNDLADRVVPLLKVECALAMATNDPGNYYSVSIEGTGNPRRTEQVFKFVRGIPGVGDVEELYVSDLLLRFRVQYPGPMTELADALRGNAFRGFRLTPLRVVDREWIFRVTPVPDAADR